MRVSEQKETIAKQINPSKIMQIGTGFWASKVLLSAVNMGLFTFLANGEQYAEEIKNEFGLHNRGLYDFLDTLVALGFLTRTGIKETAKYKNAEDADLFLDKNKPSYIGGILEMANNRLYSFWGGLEEALKTGKPQNEIKNEGENLFEAIYSNPVVLEEFLNAMTGVQMGNFAALAEKFNFTPYKTLCDIGGAGGFLSIIISKANPHLSCITFDLPQVEPIASKNISRMRSSDNVTVQSGDFFNAPLPSADVITMGNILHDWSEEEKLLLMKKAYNALPDNGVFIAIENVIDNDRKQNAFGLMMSLNMLIETPGGFDYTAADFESWATAVGFKEVVLMPLTGPTSAAIAYK